MMSVLSMTAMAATDKPTSPETAIINNQRRAHRASDANIFGHVVAVESGEHLPYATVAIKGTTYGCALSSGSG